MRKIIVFLSEEITEELQKQIDGYDTAQTELHFFTNISDLVLQMNVILSVLDELEYRQGNNHEYLFMTDMENLYQAVTMVYHQIFSQGRCYLLTNKSAVKADLEPIYAELYDKYHFYTEMRKVETCTYYYYLNDLYYCLEPVAGERAIISEEGVEYGNPPIEKIVYGYSHIEEILRAIIILSGELTKEEDYTLIDNAFISISEDRKKQISELEFAMFSIGIEDSYLQKNENLIFYSILCTSFLAIETGNSRYLNQMNECVLKNTTLLSFLNKYFIWQQQVHMQFTNIQLADKKGLGEKIYQQVYLQYATIMQEFLKPIQQTERDKDCIFVLTVQFLDEGHAPTDTALERIYTLGKMMGKKVRLINTREKMSLKGYVPIYMKDLANIIDRYNGKSEYTYKDYTFDFYQCPYEMPDIKEIGHVLNMIRESKPYMILTIGSGSLLSDLVAHIVPVLNIGVVFSGLRKVDNQFAVTGRHISEVERQVLEESGYCLDSIIESTFTFELKKQEHHYSRKDLNLPDDEFLLLTVGTRLHNDVQEDFVEMIETVLQEKMHLVFAGLFHTYSSLCERYPVLKQHSTFLGYQDDILAVTEICDLYVNPRRLGGGFSIAEAFYHGKPGVMLEYGDVAAAAGSGFWVKDYEEMQDVIRKYKNNPVFYHQQSAKALERVKILTDSKASLQHILEEAECRTLFF